MSTDERDREGFFTRWSRLKEQANDESGASSPARPDDDPPALPPVDELTFESDYRGFFHPKVDEGLRRAALRKLFSEPHFNVMDGLDVYIDDYSKSDPLPTAMVERLQQAQNILRWAAESQEAPVAQAAPAVAGTSTESTSSSAAAAPESDPAAEASATPAEQQIPQSHGEET